MIPIEKLAKQEYPIHALHLQTATEKLLWNQKLDHYCDQYLYNPQKYIYGVPRFSKNTSQVLDQCPNFIQANMSKTSTVHGTNRAATQPYQGLTIDFSFSRMTSDDSEEINIYEGINDET